MSRTTTGPPTTSSLKPARYSTETIRIMLTEKKTDFVSLPERYTMDGGLVKLCTSVGGGEGVGEEGMTNLEAVKCYFQCF